MTDETRNPNGTFKKGHKISTGRPKGVRNKATILIENEGLKIFRMVIDRALSGDAAAQDLVFKAYLEFFGRRRSH